VADDAEVASLPALGEQAYARFGAGSALAVHGESSGRFQLWDVSTSEPALRLEERGIARWSWAFHPNGRLVAVGDNDGAIRVYDVISGRRWYVLAPMRAMAGHAISLHPTEPLIEARSYLSRVVLVRDLRSGAVVASTTPSWPGGNGDCAWSPDGRFLLVPEGDGGRIQQYAFDPIALALRPMRTLEGPPQGSPAVVYSPAGDRFVTRGWSCSVHLVDAVSGRLLFPTHRQSFPDYNLLRFDRTGKRLAVTLVGKRNDRIGLWSVADAREYRYLMHSGSAEAWRVPAIHPGGRLAAIGSSDGMALFDLETGRELAHMPIPNSYITAHFDGVGNLLASGHNGFFRWPVRLDPASRGRLVIGPPESLPFHGGQSYIATSRDGRVIAQSMFNGYGTQQYAGGWILHPNSPTPRQVDAGSSMHWNDVSSDGRWVAFGVHDDWVIVYDSATGQRVWKSPIDRRYYCRFSPDGRWLITDADGGRLYSVGTWEPGPQLGPGIPWDATSKLAVMGQTNGVYRLVELATGRELAQLEDPEQNIGAATFTRDGTKLVVAAKNGLRVWDLRRIRAELVKLGLDWDAPSYPEPSASEPRPLEVQLVGLEQVVSDPMSLNNWAWPLLTGPAAKRDPALALKLIQKAVEQQPRNALFLNTLGVAQYRNDDYARAIGTLQKSLDAGKGQWDGFDLFFLAMCHARLAQPAKAKDCFERAVTWCDGKKDLSAQHAAELKAFRSEAETVLKEQRAASEK
jgi:WD40 repeat protein